MDNSAGKSENLSICIVWALLIAHVLTILTYLRFRIANALWARRFERAKCPCCANASMPWRSFADLRAPFFATIAGQFLLF